MKKIFISYSHKDEDWKNLLVKQLKGKKGTGKFPFASLRVSSRFPFLVAAVGCDVKVCG